MKSVEEQSVAGLALDDDTVMQYLLQNPDFFIRNVRQVEQMRVPHPVRGTVSLVEWHLARQRNHIERLEEEITLLMEQASANEGLFARLLHLQADLATADSLQDMLNRLQRWARGFGLAGATVRLFAERWKIGAPSDFTHGADAFGVRAVPHSAAGQRTTLPRRPERPRTAAAVAAGQTDWPGLARWRCRCWATTANWAW